MIMPETLTISLAQPVLGLRVVDGSARPKPEDGGQKPERSAGARDVTSVPIEPSDRTKGLDTRQNDLARLCETVDNLVGKLDRLYQQTVAHSHADIATLAVEIARKIVMCEIGKGNYDIQAIVEEALKRAPSHQDIVVRVNPQDAPQCQQLQRERPDSELAQIQFIADWSVPKANCLIETPKGIVRSFVEEGLERIREALEKAQ